MTPEEYLQELCRDNLLRVEIFAAMGMGTYTVEAVDADKAHRAGVYAESEDES